MCVCKGRQMLFFWLEKSIACASSGSAQGPEHRQAGEDSAEACDEGKEAVKEMLSSSPSSSVTIRLITRPRLTRCQKARGHCKVASNKLGYIFSVHVFRPSKFSKPTVLRNSHPHNSVLFCWVTAKGPEARAAFSPPEISRQLKPPAQPLVWFLLDPCRNHAIWRQIYLLESKKKTKLSQATNLQLPPTQ